MTDTHPHPQQPTAARSYAVGDQVHVMSIMQVADIYQIDGITICELEPCPGTPRGARLHLNAAYALAAPASDLVLYKSAEHTQGATGQH